MQAAVVVSNGAGKAAAGFQNGAGAAQLILETGAEPESQSRPGALARRRTCSATYLGDSDWARVR